MEKLAKIAGNPTVRASPLAWKITPARRSKLAKIAGNPTVRASPLAGKNSPRSRIKIGKNRRKSYSASVPARVEKYPSLAWKNTHRSRIKIGKNRRKFHSASVPARVEKYPSLAGQNWQKLPEIPQCERGRSRERIAHSRAKINKDCRKSHSASGDARVEKYPSLAWKNTHRSRGKININSVQESTSIVRQNQYI